MVLGMIVAGMMSVDMEDRLTKRPMCLELHRSLLEIMISWQQS